MDSYNAVRFNVIRFFILPIGFMSMLMACKQGEGISLGNDDSGMGVEIMDTLSVDASTFLLDPLPTAGTGTMLVGNLADSELGALSVSSYFRLGISALTLSSLPDDAVYDSLSLRLHYSGYYYGDTTTQQKLGLYRLAEDLELTEIPIALEDDEMPIFVQGATLWSDRQFAHDRTPLGEVSFRPRPTSTDDTVKIRVDDALGNALFTMAKNNDVRLTNAEDFVNFLKGFMLVSQGSGGCITGFRDSVLLNLHYSYERQTDGLRVEDTLKFALNERAYQYNQVETDRTGSSLESLSYENNEIPAGATGQKTYVLGTSGLVARLRFPHARAFMNHANIAVSKAQMVIETVQSTYQLHPPPSALNIMVANKYGTPTAYFPASYGSGTQMASFQPASLSGGAGKGKYVFDLTQYVSDMRNDTASEEESLLLTIPVSTLMNTVDRLVIASDGDRPAIKLHILYTKF
ncbi:DUF4270 domain-containing protein [Parapedobacter tibetensis]|uniref:DUF4270 domain-containing protein n=1 Tax=Parapedobacter tibetensis TaxID=2972951 RepID=UPI00214DC0A5|nr:DUF4270 domain-containing protein [Parapedobacter tibetensis]